MKTLYLAKEPGTGVRDDLSKISGEVTVVDCLNVYGDYYRKKGYDCVSWSSIDCLKGMKFDVVIGNPPYGNAGRMALKFLNKIAEERLSDDIRLIMPRSIRKAALMNSINRHIHIVEDVTNDDMLFGRKIKTVTQRYVYKDELRPLIAQPRTHKDFKFLKKGDPNVNVFVMRSGMAGRVLTEGYNGYEKSHYFIHANTPKVIENLQSISDELVEIGNETTGMGKVSIPEIVSTYIEHFGE